MKTKKNRLSNLLKTGILLLGISLLLWNCETNNEITQEEAIIENDDFFAKYVTDIEIPEITKNLKSKFPIAKNSNTSLNLNYNNILEITDSLEAKTYSFKFNKVYNEEYFANIIVQKNNDGTIEPPLVYKYIPTEEFNIEYLKGNKDITDFTGEIEMYSLDNFLISHNNQTKSKSAFNGAPCGAVDIFGIGSNNGYGSTGSGTTGGGTTCEVRRYVTSCSCKGDLVGPHNHQQTGVVYEITCTKNYKTKGANNNFPCGRNSNNGRTTVGVNEPPMIPCFDSSNCEEEYISNVLNNISNLNQSQINWVSDFKNIRTIVKLSAFLDENNNSIDAKNWVKGQIELEILTKNIPWKASVGTLANLKYTHTYFDGSRGYFKLEDGSIVVSSSSEQTLTTSGDLRDKYNDFNPNDKYYYIKIPGEQWAEMLFNPDNLSDGLRNLFKLGAIDLGKNLGRYVLPIEDIMVLINGKDFDGQDVSRWQAAGFILLTVVPGSKALKPVARIATNATRWTKVISKGGKSYRYTSKIVNGIVEFGTYNSTKFREILEIANNTLKQAHHVLSRNLRTHRTIQKAARNKNNPFHIDELLNGIPVDTWRNQPNHFQYDTRLRNILDRIPSSLSEEDTYNRLIDIIGRLKDVIKNNPNTHLNDLIF